MEIHFDGELSMPVALIEMIVNIIKQWEHEFLILIPNIVVRFW